MYKIIDCNRIIGNIFYCYLFSDRLKQSNISGLFYDMVLSDRLVVKYHPVKDKIKVLVCAAKTGKNRIQDILCGINAPQTISRISPFAFLQK